MLHVAIERMIEVTNSVLLHDVSEMKEKGYMDVITLKSLGAVLDDLPLQRVSTNLP